MRKKVTQKIELLRKNGDESFVRILGQNNENMGTMKINTSLLPSELASNQYYSITFRNEYNTDDYINVATITDLHPSGEYCPKFCLTGKVTYTHTMPNKWNDITMVSMRISDSDGHVLQGMTYSDSFPNNTLVKKDDEITVEVSLAKLKDTETTKDIVKYNFFKKSQSKIVKNRDGEKDKNTATPVDSEVKKAQNEIEKLLDKLAKKGWIAKETPKTPCTAIGFQSTVHSTTNAVNIIDIRALEAILKSDVLQEVSKKLFGLKKGVDVEYKTCKEQLPALVPMAQVNAKNRTKETCTSNGLVFLDVDGIEYSLCERILSYIKENKDINSKVLIWNLSPSRKGFHLIFAPFDGVDTIVANQEHICSVINAALECEIKPDAQCFDVSRAAFITSEYYLGGAASLLTVDNPTVLPQIQEGVAYKPAAKKMILKRTKTSDGCTFDHYDGEYPDMDDVSVHIDVEDFQTLDCYAYENKYVEGKRNQWWELLGVRFRAKGYTQTLAEPIFAYAMEYVQLLPEYKPTVDDPINSNEAFDAFMWAFKKENWEAYSAIPTTIADEDLPLGLRKSTSVSEFIAQFAELEDDLPKLFRDNSDTFFDSEKNLNLLPFQVMSTAEICSSYTSGIKHVDYNDKTYKNALQMIIVAETGNGKSGVSDNNKEGFGKILYKEFAHYMTNEFNDSESESTSTTIPNATNAKVKDEIFRANRNNVDPVLHTHCSEMGLFRKQQNSPHGGLDFEIMKNGWDGDSFNCATKSKDGVSGFVDSLHLSALISATPIAVQDYTPKSAITDGTINRLCFCFAQTDDYERSVMYQRYDAVAIAQYVDWARKQRGTIVLEDIFGGEAKDKTNDIWSPYIKIWNADGYGYLSDLTIRTSVNAKRIAREYYLMDLYEKGYNLIEHEGKTKVVKDNIISDMPKAAPWLIQLMRVTYEYLVFGVHTLFGERAARISAKSKTKSGKKQMYIDIYNALPDSFSKEELKAKVLALGKNEKAINNLVTNWNKNEVWTFDQATGMYTKKCAA
ncbi:MAG: DUF3987 domain-containing protein [Bacteroidales bacterium]|nr:DUF3987 domain-containing protein [Bacteroidales bacterium]